MQRMKNVVLIDPPWPPNVEAKFSVLFVRSNEPVHPASMLEYAFQVA
jgi:hypothetical protein